MKENLHKFTILFDFSVVDSEKNIIPCCNLHCGERSVLSELNLAHEIAHCFSLSVRQMHDSETNNLNVSAFYSAML